MSPITLQQGTRAAAVQLLLNFTHDADIKMQVYRARPATIKPPTGFVDRMGDRLDDFLAPAIFQHVSYADIVVLHGVFDHGDTVDQRDRFVDGFLDWMRTRFHQAGPNSLIRVRSVDDDPTFIPDWIREEDRKIYYATVIRVEGDQTD